MRTGRFEPQRLVDHARQQRAVRNDLAALVGVLGEHLGEPADEPAGGLVAGTGDHLRVVQHLLAGELARHTVLVLELDVEQGGHQVVGGVLGTPVDVVGVDAAVGDLVGVDHLHRCSRAWCAGWRRWRHVRTICSDSGMPSSMPMTRIGIIEASSAMMSNPSEPTKGFRQLTQILPDLVLDRGHPARREHPRHEAAQHRVDGRILEHHHALGHVELRLDQFEDVAAAVGERLPVEQRPLDVGVPRQRPEVVALVVVDRRFLAQPRVRRVGVRDDVRRRTGRSRRCCR